MKTIHDGDQRGLRRPTAASGSSPTPRSAGEEGWPEALGGLSGFCGVQHYTQHSIDFCMMVWYSAASWTKLSSNNVELKNGKGQMSTSFPSSCPPEKRAGQSQGGRAERHHIQAWCSRRPLRRPSANSHPPPAEGEGPVERGHGALCCTRRDTRGERGYDGRPRLAARAIHATSLWLSRLGKVKHTSLRFRGHLHGPGASFSLTLSAECGIVGRNGRTTPTQCMFGERR